MHITLHSLDCRHRNERLLAEIQITTDEHGYLYAAHETLDHEVECALYGFQEGGASTDLIEDEDGIPYIRWTIHQ